MLKGLDLDDFWQAPKDSRDYIEGPITPAVLRSVEKDLGFRLPRAYVELMRRSQNGGHPKRTAFPTKTPTSWAEDHIEITGFFGIGRKKPSSLLGAYGSRFAQTEIGYPTWGICICDCPSAGHDMVMLDYRACGPKGEPAVVHVDQELDFKVTKLAPDFDTFVRGLVDSSVFHDEDDAPPEPDPKEQLKATLRIIKTGRFSKDLRALLARSKAPRKTEKALRRVLAELATDKGVLIFGDDARSYLVYDVLFALYTAVHTVRIQYDYLEPYGYLLEVGDTELRAAYGYTPFYIERWFRARKRAGQIIKRDGGLTFTDRYRARVDAQLHRR
jgi:hypothetical protein